MKTEADKRRAERKNRIGEHYWRESRLDTQMFYGADQYLTYGFVPPGSSRTWTTAAR
jgi:hypothetical protein